MPVAISRPISVALNAEPEIEATKKRIISSREA
jgi:hypothetical protein